MYYRKAAGLPRRPAPEAHPELGRTRGSGESAALTSRVLGNKGAASIQLACRPLAPRRHLGLRLRWPLAISMLLLLGVLLALLPVFGGLVGWVPYVLHGKSMEPTISPGSLLLARSVAAERVHPGDVVAFPASWVPIGATPRTVVHRVVHLADKDGSLLGYTQGDNSPMPDPEPVLFQDRVQLVSFVVPYLGHVYEFVGGKGAFIVFLLTLLGIVALLDGKLPLASCSSMVGVYSERRSMVMEDSAEG